MKRLYSLFAIAGFVVPYYFLMLFISAHGLDLSLLINQLFANHISTFFAVDLIITAIVFLVYSNIEARKVGLKNWWVYLLSTLVVGPSFAIPLFLYFRHDKVS